jgi:hypothetical protein
VKYPASPRKNVITRTIARIRRTKAGSFALNTASSSTVRQTRNRKQLRSAGALTPTEITGEITLANFGEMAVALQLARHGIEDQMFRLRRLCRNITMSTMGEDISIQHFEHDAYLIDEAIVILRELSRYENDVLDLILAKNTESVAAV